VAKRRVAQVVAQTRHFNQIWVGAESHPQFTSDLTDFKTVSQSRPRKILFTGNDDLGLAGQPPQPGRMQYAGPVTRKRRPALALGRLRNESLLVMLGIAGREQIVGSRGQWDSTMGVTLGRSAKK
jgi:hypothetical protein